MKKAVSVTALVLAAVMLLCLTACYNGGKLEAGTYTLKDVSGEGKEVFEDYIDEAKMELKDDGSAVITLSAGSTIDLQFNEETGRVTYKNVDAPYTVKDKKITIGDDSGLLVFNK